MAIDSTPAQSVPRPLCRFGECGSLDALDQLEKEGSSCPNLAVPEAVTDMNRFGGQMVPGPRAENSEILIAGHGRTATKGRLLLEHEDPAPVRRVFVMLAPIEKWLSCATSQNRGKAVTDLTTQPELPEGADPAPREQPLLSEDEAPKPSGTPTAALDEVIWETGWDSAAEDADDENSADGEERG